MTQCILCGGAQPMPSLKHQRRQPNLLEAERFDAAVTVKAARGFRA